jgi:hypothetical protein
VDDPNSTARATAAHEVAGAALSLARARDVIAQSAPTETRTLIDYVSGWVNRLLVEIVEPPETAERDEHTH